MNFIFDTNILVYYISKPDLLNEFEREHEPFAERNVAMISLVTHAELKSIGVMRNWGSKRLGQLDVLVGLFLRIPINTERQIEAYAEIDAYSQRKHAGYTYPEGFSSYNMGKNDLWIAATAMVTGSKLVTADHDFNHLNGVFFEVVKVSP